MRLFLYKLLNDTGAAPHVQDGLLSLAICKPRIRKSAAIGDWVFGFGARSNPAMRGERLLYVARVTAKLPRGEYFERPEFRSRWDCIYDRRGGRLVLREGSLFHADDPKAQWKDIGDPPLYDKANVLVSDDFRYLGADGTTDYMRRWPNLGLLVSVQKQGHRVFERDAPIARELLALQRALWESPPSVHPPSQPVGMAPLWSCAALPSSGMAGGPFSSTAGCGARRSPPPRRSRC